MRWTRQRQAREICSQGGYLVSGHGAQDVGAEAYGKTVWFWHPWLVSSCRWRMSIQPDRSSHQAGSDGGKRNSSPGRARHKPSNHCAGNAGVLRLYLYARVRISLHHCTRDRGCSKHPAFPAPSLEGKGSCKPRTQSRREKARSCLRTSDANEFAMPGKEPRQRE